MAFNNTTDNAKYPYKYPIKNLEVRPTKNGSEYAHFHTCAKDKYNDETGNEVVKYTEGEVWIFGKCSNLGLAEGKMFSFKLSGDTKFAFYPNSYISKSGKTAGKVCQVQLMKFYSPECITIYDSKFQNEIPKPINVVSPANLTDAKTIEPIGDLGDGLPF